jgi:hypothetical protein
VVIRKPRNKFTVVSRTVAIVLHVGRVVGPWHYQSPSPETRTP